MKILVISDSHGDTASFDSAVRRHRSADVIVFCGDGHRDLQTIRAAHRNKAYIAVAGNCDWYCDLPLVQQSELCSKKIIVTHGHMFGVKNGLSRIIDLGRSNGFDIVLFGHTHQQVTSAEGAMLIMNPGSIGCEGEYGIIEIDERTGMVTATEYPRSDIPPLKMNTISDIG